MNMDPKLEHLHSAEFKNFVDKQGNEIKSTLTKVDMKSLVETVV